jgi:hypothetical protein
MDFTALLGFALYTLSLLLAGLLLASGEPGFAALLISSAVFCGAFMLSARLDKAGAAPLSEPTVGPPRAANDNMNERLPQWWRAR